MSKTNEVSGPKQVNEENLNRINQLEYLFTEQDQSLHTLNEIVTRQDREITAMQNRLLQLETLVKSLKDSTPAGVDGSAFEKPPHY